MNWDFLLPPGGRINGDPVVPRLRLNQYGHLRRAGIYRLSDLCRTSFDELLQVRNIGPVTARRLLRWQLKQLEVQK